MNGESSSSYILHRHVGLYHITNLFCLYISADCLPYIPEKGTVGASGDLAPLAHLTLGLMGEGKMWSPTTRSFDDAAKVCNDLIPRPPLRLFITCSVTKS